MASLELSMERTVTTIEAYGNTAAASIPLTLGKARETGRLRPGQLLMHPGPVNRGIELSADAIDSDQALIGDQVKAGVAVRMAVLYELLVGSPVLAAVA